MDVIRIRESGTFRPLHVVMIFLVAVTVTGGCLLLSAAESTTLVDGAVEWQAESPLRAVVQTLCLNYKFPTIHPGEIKGYLLGLGAGLAMLALAVAIFTRPRGEGEDAGVSTNATLVPVRAKIHVGPLVAAQALVGLYVLWSFASSRWSPTAVDIAIGGSILLAIQFLWAFGIGHGLSPAGARVAARIVVAALALSAATAVWYYYGRNPVLAAKFPFGNPTFLAACLIPGILLGATLLIETIASLLRAKQASSVLPVLASVVAVVVCVWAFFLTRSRGPAVGLVFGAVALLFFVNRGWWKLVPSLMAIVIAVAGWLYIGANLDAASPTGRSATMRFRLYSWEYAWTMFLEEPFKGHGQGGFALLGDSHVASDVLEDPLPFVSRIAHAHNEWLEVMADLGAIGIGLIGSAIALTLIAGMHALEGPMSWRDRWVLLGCMSALVGLGVEECFGVGLRVSEVPLIFFTVIGLIWALAGPPQSVLVGYASATRGRRALAGVVGGVLGIATLVIAQQDLAVTRDAYRTDSYLREGDDEDATRAASMAVFQLNPQRALTNRYRLAETHLVLAERLLGRALDRHRRSSESVPPDSRLAMLAEEDFAIVDERWKAASRELKELVSRSPDFINSGRLDYRINLIRARIPPGPDADGNGERFAQAAATALERELRRQPFDTRLATDYLFVAAAHLTLEQVVHVLARPLRHNRITESYLDVIRYLDSDPDLDSRLDPLLDNVRRAVRKTPPPNDGDVPIEWGPEKLRIGAALSFLRGDFSRSVEDLELASTAYEELANSAPMGAAACYAELADARFFNDPYAPTGALESAERASKIAPWSQEGRRLKDVVERRMIQYHLAGGDEANAVRLLKRSAPPGATQEVIQGELGVRLRRLCESLIARNSDSLADADESNELLSRLRSWQARGIELAPFDARSHYLAADLALFAGERDEAVEHLRRALEEGLSVDVALRLIDAALEKTPDDSVLLKARRTIAGGEPEGGPVLPDPLPTARGSAGSAETDGP